jgi:hypothetical protein
MSASPNTPVNFTVFKESQLFQVPGLNTMDEVTIYSDFIGSYGTLFVFGNDAGVSMTRPGVFIQTPFYTIHENTLNPQYVGGPAPITQKLPSDFFYYRVYQLSLGSVTDIDEVVLRQKQRLSHFLNFSGW